jgi:sugar transferase (PEP-CTERM/EpsH1 system associated)
LCERYRVHLGFFVDDPADWPHVPSVEAMAERTCAVPLDRRWKTISSVRGLVTGQALSLPYFFDRRLAAWVQDILLDVRPQVAFLFSSPMAQYLTVGPRPPRVVMDFVDVDSAKWQQYADRRRWPTSWVYRREASRLAEFERSVAGSVDASMFVTLPERALFCSRAPDLADRVHAVENGIDADFYSPDRPLASPYPDGGPILAFTGAMDYWPNVDAACWFCQDILPLLRARSPALRFFVVGSNPTPAVCALDALDGVTVTGSVPDMRPYIAHATAIVAPLRTARGVQNKVLEGMAMGRPVIATRQAYDGIIADQGVHLLVSDAEPKAFADCVFCALDRNFATSLGSAARQRIVDLYDWSRRFASLDALLAEQPSVAMPLGEAAKS